jgi:phospholipid/cholesterol/gamma-HCH transport system permease protein
MAAAPHDAWPPAGPEARARWLGHAQGMTLQLAGHWQGGAAQGWAPLPELPAAPSAPSGNPPLAAVLAFDTTGLQAWDLGLAAKLWPLVAAWQARGGHVDTTGLPPGLGALLSQALQRLPAPGPATPAPGPRPRSPALVTLAFFGQVLLALWRSLRGRGGPGNLPADSLLQQLDLTGPRSLPIVLLACALLGVMLAYMGGAQLGRIGAQGFLADVVTVGMVRELGGLMTGIILAGRVGAAFAAQLASMQANEEIDALRVLGLDPVAHLVLPRLLALLLVAPGLIVLGALAGVLAGWPAAVFAYNVGAAEYLHQSLAALTPVHLWIGLFKGMLYAALVALAGCREGLHAGRSAEAVGEATTRAVVKGLVWIVAAACGTTVFFTGLGY